ncbi:MAG: coproporphyrinogen dehydrogenase HemZ [Anaerococcus sp.]|nr:coproporphyrinogen dehydrogenase HemZ [Anaerococcus sp.]
MKFYVKDQRDRKQVFDILNIFFDHDELKFSKEADLYVGDGKISYGGNLISYKKDTLKASLYDLLSKDLSYKAPWGYLTGSKPSKLLKKISLEEIKKTYRVSDQKIDLLKRVKEEQDKLYFDKSSFNLYINIPFCPQRCSYCSYPTLIGPKHDRSLYIDRLIKELKGLDLDKDLDSIYIGGGTPSYLDNKDLARLLDELINRFNFKEFTLEAGREDTLDYSKLKIMKERKVGRISLNPQSFNQEIAKKAGRAYDLDNFLKIYEMAKDLGFIVNMDFIVGLLGEDRRLFSKNFRLLEKLLPDNITFHVLAMKVGSKYFEKHKKADKNESELISRDIEDFIKEHSYKPYYLYRQKKQVSNLENIGYQRNDTSQRYNIIVNEEKESLIGLGMNANSKLINGKKFRNARNLRDYYENLDELIRAKNKLINEYNENIRRNYGN